MSSVNFSTEALHARKKWQVIFQVLKEKKLSQKVGPKEVHIKSHHTYITQD